MLKKILIGTLILVLAVAIVFSAANQVLAKNGEPNPQSQPGNLSVANTDQGNALVNGQGSGGIGRGNGSGNNPVQDLPRTSLPPVDSDGLSDEEVAALLFMIEEEKLAHDLYLSFSELWGLPLFANIASSEQTHIDSVNILFDRYGVENTASSQRGVFSNPELQSLYDQYLNQGSQSATEALKVGAAIEEIDILDLQERSAATDNLDIQQIFANLLAGSKNHLKSFVRMLENQTGEIYEPQFLSLADYQNILNETGVMGGGGNGGNGNKGGGQQRGRP